MHTTQAQVLKKLKPLLDEVALLENQCKIAAREVEVAHELVDAEEDNLTTAKDAGRTGAEIHKIAQTSLLNERTSVLIILPATFPRTRARTQQAHPDSQARTDTVPHRHDHAHRGTTDTIATTTTPTCLSLGTELISHMYPIYLPPWART